MYVKLIKTKLASACYTKSAKSSREHENQNVVYTAAPVDWFFETWKRFTQGKIWQISSIFYSIEQYT